MSVNSTNQTGFFKRVGNWFNRNGDVLGESLQLAGKTAMGVGLTGMMIHEMKHSSCGCNNDSIWGGGFGGCMSPMMSPMGMFGGGCMSPMMNPMGMFGGGCMSPWSMMNPMNMYNGAGMFRGGYMSSIMNPMNMFNRPGMFGTMRMFNNMQNNITNPYSPILNNRSAINSQYTNVNSSYNQDYTDQANETAELTDAEKANTSKGEAMNEAFDVMAPNGTAVSGKKFKYAEEGEDESSALQENAKSFIAYVDKENGDGDGLIDEDEFVAHKTGSATESQTREIFKQFDLNGDGNIDWKEYSALLRTYDGNDDGTIISKEFVAGQKLSALNVGKGDNDLFRTKIIRSYKKLFGDDSI